MVSTFVLRLLSEQLAAGQAVGMVETVGTGEIAIVRSTDELVSFLHTAPGREQGGPGGAGRRKEP